MSQKYFGSGIPVANGFDLSAHKPLDARGVVATLTDRDSIPAIQLYAGLEVFVEEEGKKYILVGHDADYSNPQWVESGAGSVVIESFTVGDDDKLVEAENIGQIIFVTVGTESYPKGPYIVTGVGAVAKLGTTTATGDIAGDVETLKGDVSTLQTDLAAVKVRLGTAEGEIDTLQVDVEGLKSVDDTLQGNINIEAKAREDADKALSDRLDTAESDIDTLEGKVAALSSATHFLGVKDKLEDVEAPATGDIVIVGNKEYVYDEVKGWVELGDTTSELSRISDLEAKVGNSESGLVKDVADNKVTISAVVGRVDVVEGRLDTAESDIDTLQEADEAIKGRLDALEAVEHPTKSQVETLENNVTTIGNDLTNLSGRVNAVEGRLDTAESDIDALQVAVGELTIKSADTTASHGVALKVTDGVVGVDVDIDSLANEVITKHSVKATDVNLGNNIGTEANPDRYTTNDTIQGVLSSMNERIESIDADIQSALEGGVTGIEAGNGITVDSTTATKPKVSVKIAEGSAIVANADGLDLTWSEF